MICRQFDLPESRGPRHPAYLWESTQHEFVRVESCYLVSPPIGKGGGSMGPTPPEFARTVTLYVAPWAVTAKPGVNAEPKQSAIANKHLNQGEWI